MKPLLGQTVRRDNAAAHILNECTTFSGKCINKEDTALNKSALKAKEEKAHAQLNERLNWFYSTAWAASAPVIYPICPDSRLLLSFFFCVYTLTHARLLYISLRLLGIFANSNFMNCNVMAMKTKTKWNETKLNINNTNNGFLRRWTVASLQCIQSHCSACSALHRTVCFEMCEQNWEKYYR